MYRALCLIGTVVCFAFSAVRAEIDIKEIGSLLDVASKDEGILLITLEVVVNGIKKTVNEEVYEAEKISEAAGKCAAGVGEEAVEMTAKVMGSYVRDMFDKTEKLTNVLKNHTATQSELEEAKNSILSEETEILVDLAVLRDEVLLPEAKKLAKKLEKCKELK